MISPSNWEQIRALFHTALERAPDERAAFLRAQSSDDEILREVASLLAAHADADALRDAARPATTLRRHPRAWAPQRREPSATLACRRATRSVCRRVPAGRGRDGGGLSRPRHESASRCRAEDPARVARGRSRPAGPLHPRSADARRAQSSAHRPGVRLRAARRCAGAGHGTGGGPGPRAAHRAWADSRGRTRCGSRGKSPRRSRRRTRVASSTGISSPPTS